MHSPIRGNKTLKKQYSPKCSEGKFCELLRLYGSKQFAATLDCWHHMYRWKATAHSVYEREEGENDAGRRHNLARPHPPSRRVRRHQEAVAEQRLLIYIVG
jgi:hypothetical protein